MKLKSLIEVKKIDEEEINNLLKKIEDYNKKLEHTKAEKILKKVDSIADQVDKLPTEVRMYQSELRIALRKEFEKKYGRETYNRLEDII